MPRNNERGGRLISPLSAAGAAAAIVALVVSKGDDQTHQESPYTTLPTHEENYEHPQPKARIAIPHRKHPRHSTTHLTPAQIADRQVTTAELNAWSKVNICEEGGDWHVRGSEYSGGLGISTTNWPIYGGEFFAPTGADATPKEQIVVAMRIQKNPPDQNGCAHGGW